MRSKCRHASGSAFADGCSVADCTAVPESADAYVVAVGTARESKLFNSLSPFLDTTVQTNCSKNTASTSARGPYRVLVERRKQQLYLSPPVHRRVLSEVRYRQVTQLIRGWVVACRHVFAAATAPWTYGMTYMKVTTEFNA